MIGRRASRIDWPQYLDAYHGDRAGITERILTSAVDRAHDSPYSWLVQPLRDTLGPILDLATGSAPTRPLLSKSRWFGVDRSAGELALASAAGRGPLVRASADALPVADNAVAAVCAAMCLQVLPPLDAVVAELKRVLAPGGMIVALVPSRPYVADFGRHPAGMYAWYRVMRALGIGSQPWPNPHARDGLARLLSAHGFTVVADQRRVFRRDIADPADAALLIDGLYLPGVDSERIHQATRTLVSWAGPGRRLPLPLRRVVAHLPKS